MIAYWRVFIPPCNLLFCQRPGEDSDWCHQNTIASDLFFCFFPLTIYVTQHEILTLCASLLSRNSFFSTPLPGKRASGEVCHQGPYITSRAIWTRGLFRRWKRMAKHRVQNLGLWPLRINWKKITWDRISLIQYYHSFYKNYFHGGDPFSRALLASE